MFHSPPAVVVLSLMCLIRLYFSSFLFVLFVFVSIVLCFWEGVGSVICNFLQIVRVFYIYCIMILFAVQLLLWLGVKNPSHFQHCAYCFVFDVRSMAGFVFRAERWATFVYSSCNCSLLMFVFDSVGHVLVLVHNLELGLRSSSPIGFPLGWPCSSVSR